MSKKIDPEAYYTLSGLVQQSLFPWCGVDIRGYRNFIIADLKGKNHLRTVVIGKGGRTRYKFQGKNIISFIEQFESGKIRI